MTTTPLPPPDTHCFDDDTQMDVWSYSAPLVEQIVKQARSDLEAELVEQARIVGMGAERELALMSSIERKDALLKRALSALELYKAYGWPDRNGVIPAITKELQ